MKCGTAKVTQLQRLPVLEPGHCKRARGPNIKHFPKGQVSFYLGPARKSPPRVLKKSRSIIYTRNVTWVAAAPSANRTDVPPLAAAGEGGLARVAAPRRRAFPADGTASDDEELATSNERKELPEGSISPDAVESKSFR